MSEATLGRVKPTAVYRLKDDAGNLLYVGIAKNPEQRFKQHALGQLWWPSVADTQLEWFDDPDQAHAAEVLAIRDERPLHNIFRYRPPGGTTKFSLDLSFETSDIITDIAQRATRARPGRRPTIRKAHVIQRFLQYLVDDEGIREILISELAACPPRD